MAELELALLGGVRVLLDGTPVRGFVSSKAQALLCYLALSGRPHLRAHLGALLWGDQPDAQAASNLRQALSNLRRLLEPFLLITRDMVAMNPQSSVRLDVARFEQAMLANAAGTPDPAELSAALALYQGELLAGLSVRDALAFEEWLLLQRERLHAQAIQGLQLLQEELTLRGEYAAAIEAGRRLLALDPWREEAHQALMLLLARSGERSAALAQYEICRRVLFEALGVPPMPETTALYERLKAAPQSVRVGQVLTPFVGREQERAELVRLLCDRAVRIVTLVGPGGIGKTRLAHELAAGEGPRFLHGSQLILLAGVDEQNTLLPAVTRALGITSGGRDLLDQAISYLREKELLLVLDNVEQIVEQAAELALAIVRGAPEVTLLVTSRERLNLPGEWVVALGGLPVPGPDEQQLERFSAAQLFLRSAERVAGRLDLTPKEAAAVARICRVVEGMPLALELAATWARVLSCAEIAAELERGLGLLRSSARGVEERHRSMRAVFDHSWRLLSAEERRVLRGLSAFRGGWDRSAWQAVVGGGLDTLAGLMDKSLLWRAPADRYGLHELVRQYAEEQLANEPGEQQAIWERYGGYYATFLAERLPAFKGGAQTEALSQIAVELENIRHAWLWAVEQRRDDILARGLESLYHFYDMRGWFQAGVEAFGQAADALDGQDGAPRITRARLQARQGALCYRLSDYQPAKTLLRQSLVVLRGVAADAALVFCLNQLGLASLIQGATLESREFCRESLALAGRIDDLTGQAFALSVLGSVAFHQGAYAEAQQLHQQSLALRTALDDRRAMAISLNNLANASWELGQHERAQELYQRALAIHEQIGDRYGLGHTRLNLGDVARLLGDYPTAHSYFESALAIFYEIGERYGIAYAMSCLGEVTGLLGDLPRAASLLEEGLAILREIGNSDGIILALNWLGHVRDGLGQPERAWPMFVEATRRARAVEFWPGVTRAFLGLARLLVRQDAQDEAVVLLAHAAQHPASTQETADRARLLLAELQASLPGERFAAALAQGQSANPEALVERIMALDAGPGEAV